MISKNVALLFFVFFLIATVSGGQITQLSNGTLAIDGEAQDWDKVPVSASPIGYKQKSSVDFTTAKVAFDDNYVYLNLKTTTNLQTFSKGLKDDLEVLQIFVDGDANKSTGLAFVESFNGNTIPSKNNGYENLVVITALKSGQYKCEVRNHSDNFKAFTSGGIAITGKGENPPMAFGKDFIELRLNRSLFKANKFAFIFAEPFRKLSPKGLARYSADFSKAIKSETSLLSPALYVAMAIFLVFYIICCFLIYKKAKLSPASALFMLTPIGFFQLLYSRWPLHEEVRELSMIEEEYEDEAQA